MKNVESYRVIVYILALCFTAFLSYFLASSSKITAEEATVISQTQARLIIGDELKDINTRLSNIEGYLQALFADASTSGPNTRRRN